MSDTLSQAPPQIAGGARPLLDGALAYQEKEALLARVIEAAQQAVQAGSASFGGQRADSVCALNELDAALQQWADWKARRQARTQNIIIKKRA